MSYRRELETRHAAQGTLRSYGADLRELAVWASSTRPRARNACATATCADLQRSSRAAACSGRRSPASWPRSAASTSRWSAEGRPPTIPPPCCRRRSARSGCPERSARDDVARLLDRIPASIAARGPRPGDVRARLLLRPAGIGDRRARRFGDRLRERDAAGHRQGLEDAGSCRSASPPRRPFARYLERARPALCSERDEQALFLSRRGRRLSPSRRPPPARALGPRGGAGGQGLAARAAPFLRHSSARRRRRPTFDPGAARPFERLDDPGVHPRRARTAATAVRPSAPKSMRTRVFSLY